MPVQFDFFNFLFIVDSFVLYLLCIVNFVFFYFFANLPHAATQKSHSSCAANNTKIIMKIPLESKFKGYLY